MDILMGLLLALIFLFCALGYVMQHLEGKKNKALGIRSTALDAEDEAEQLAAPAEYFLKGVRLVKARGWWLTLRYHSGTGWAQAAVFIPYGHPAEHKVRSLSINRLKLRFRRLAGLNQRQVASYLDVDVISLRA